MSEKVEKEIVRSSREGKFIGYCPDCSLVIMNLDLVGEKYFCGGCGINILEEDLSLEKEIKKWKTKKEYLRGNSGNGGIREGTDFYLNKSTTEYNKKITSSDIKKEIVASNDEEDTLE